MSSFMHSPIQRLRTISSSFRHLTGGADEDPYGDDDGRGTHTLDLAAQLNEWANHTNDPTLYSDQANDDSLFPSLNGFSPPRAASSTSSNSIAVDQAQPASISYDGPSLHSSNSSSGSLHQSVYDQQHDSNQHYPDEFGTYSMVQHSLNSYDMDVDDTSSAAQLDSRGNVIVHDREVSGKDHSFISNHGHEFPSSSNGDSISSHRTRNRASKQLSSSTSYGAASHAHPYSASSSPARSRSNSIRGLASLSITTPSPGSGYSFGGLPSPFRQPPSPSLSAGTMDPVQSVRSSSPSDTSSVSGHTMSRVGSSSAASSIHGGESSSQPATPYRNVPSAASAMSSSAGSSRVPRPTHTRRLSGSPVKPSRNTKKLTDRDRRSICQYRDDHPSAKQDDIGLQFGVERSTVSKILKLKDKWLAITDDMLDEDGWQTLPGKGGRQSRDSYYDAPTPFYSASGPSTGCSTYQIDEVDEHGSDHEKEPRRRDMPQVTGGRYPGVDNGLARWARKEIAAGRGPVTDDALQAQAKVIASSQQGTFTFKASITWLEGFKHRAGLSNGLFADSPKPESKLDEHAESVHSVDGGERNDTSERADDDDDDFSEGSGRRISIRGTRRQVALSARKQQQALEAAAAAAVQGLHSSSSSSSMSRPGTAQSTNSTNLGNGTPMRNVYDNEATPTHSTVHSRATSAAAEQRLFDSMYSSGGTERDGTDQQQQQQQSYDQPQHNTIRRSSTMSSVIHQQQQQQQAQEQQGLVHATPSRRSSIQASPNLIGNYSPSDVNGASAFPSYSMSTSSSGTGGGLHASYSTNDLTSYPLQSPFQTSSSQSSFGQYAINSHPGSGASSPVPSFQHGRSGSTASTTSSYSGLTAFSSQNGGSGTPLTGSMYGSFPNCSHSQPNSVPSTPGYGAGTGYFGHGPDGTQSQLQAAFISGGGSSVQTQTVPTQTQCASPSYGPGQTVPQLGQPAQPARRATISGGLPFSSPAQANASRRQRPVTLDQACASLDNALDYLKSAEAQGLAEPKDLLLIWELKEKMVAARSKKQQLGGAAPSSQSSHSNGRFVFPPVSSSTASSSLMSGSNGGLPQRRIKLSRTQSASSIAGLGALSGYGSGLGNGAGGSLSSSMMSRRNGSTVSLLDQSMGVKE